MAVKTARERGREERGIERPEMVVPLSAHPAFAKAAHYFGLDLKLAPLADAFRAEVRETEKLLTDRTVLLVGSAHPSPMIERPASSLFAFRGEFQNSDERKAKV